MCRTRVKRVYSHGHKKPRRNTTISRALTRENSTLKKQLVEFKKGEEINKEFLFNLLRLLKSDHSVKEFQDYIDKNGHDKNEVFRLVNILQDESRHFARVRGKWWYKFFSRFFK